MSDFGDLIPQFLHGKDIPEGRAFPTMILAAKVHTFPARQGRPEESCLLLKVALTPKIVACKVLNMRRLAASYGTRTEMLINKPIVLKRGTSNFGPTVEVEVPGAPAQPASGPVLRPADPFAGSAPATPSANGAASTGESDPFAAATAAQPDPFSGASSPAMGAEFNGDDDKSIPF